MMGNKNRANDHNQRQCLLQKHWSTWLSLFPFLYLIATCPLISRRFLQAIPASWLFLETCIKRYTQMLTKRHTSRETNTVLNFLNKNMWCHLPDLYIHTSGLKKISSNWFRVDLSFFLRNMPVRLYWWILIKKHVEE